MGPSVHPRICLFSSCGQDISGEVEKSHCFWHKHSLQLKGEVYFLALKPYNTDGLNVFSVSSLHTEQNSLEVNTAGFLLEMIHLEELIIY